MDSTSSKRTSVPCPCPACDGRLVTKYVHRNHMKAFVALNTCTSVVDQTPDNHEHCDRSSECNKELEEDISAESQSDENSCYGHSYEADDVVDNCDTEVPDNCKESEKEATDSDNIKVNVVESEDSSEVLIDEDENEEVANE